MTRRLASWLLLIAMASSGAYAVASPRVTSPVRIEGSIVQQEESQAEKQTTVAPPLDRTVLPREDSRPPRPLNQTALYQRPPPAGHWPLTTDHC